MLSFHWAGPTCFELLLLLLLLLPLLLLLLFLLVLLLLLLQAATKRLETIQQAWVLALPFSNFSTYSTKFFELLQESLHAARQLGLQDHEVYSKSAELFSSSCDLFALSNILCFKHLKHFLF